MWQVQKNTFPLLYNLDRRLRKNSQCKSIPSYLAAHFSKLLEDLLQPLQQQAEAAALQWPKSCSNRQRQQHWPRAFSNRGYQQKGSMQHLHKFLIVVLQPYTSYHSNNIIHLLITYLLSLKTVLLVIGQLLSKIVALFMLPSNKILTLLIGPWWLTADWLMVVDCWLVHGGWLMIGPCWLTVDWSIHDVSNDCFEQIRKERQRQEEYFVVKFSCWFESTVIIEIFCQA